MKGFIGVMDNDISPFLSHQPGINEVDFRKENPTYKLRVEVWISSGDHSSTTTCDIRVKCE